MLSFGLTSALIILESPSFEPIKEKISPLSDNLRDEIMEALRSGDLEKLSILIFNDLQDGVFEKYPFLAMLKNAVIKTNALCCMMTGSGPTLFAVYADASIRDRAAEELQAAFPEVGIIVAEQLK